MRSPGFSRMDKCLFEPTSVAPISNGGRFQEAAMHWRKVPDKTDGKIFYIVVSVLLASVALTTTLLVLHFHT